MSFHTFARSTVPSHNRTKLFLGTVCAVLLATATAQAKSYKGAEVDSKKAYLYGRVEIRMRMIRGGGMISTFFTYKTGSELSGNVWEEIDIEVFGKDNAMSWQSNIMSSFPRDHSEEAYPVEESLADDYHTYTLEWTPDYVLWLFDGKEMRKTVGGQAKDLVSPETLRFNAWISDSVGWAGEFDESALPAYQFVNWIKYYRYEDGKFIYDWVDDFNTFDTSRWAKANWTFDGNLVDFDPENAVVKDGTLILALTKEGETGFPGTVPADPQGNAGPAPTGGTGGSSSDSSSPREPNFKSTGGCSYGESSGSGRGEWGALFLLGLALLGLRPRSLRRR
jgi:endo-1,3-1,4-beta-glycanase ExoK